MLLIREVSMIGFESIKEILDIINGANIIT
jgi:hypothetical protein